MPRKDANWVGFQASDEEKTILEQYCYIKRQTKTEVLRGLIRGLHPSAIAAELSEAFIDELSEWTGKPTATYNKGEIREWLQSLGAEADQEVADAKLLRSMAEQMITIAGRLEK